jgi:hypothetical protein
VAALSSPNLGAPACFNDETGVFFCCFSPQPTDAGRLPC